MEQCGLLFLPEETLLPAPGSTLSIHNGPSEPPSFIRPEGFSFRFADRQITSYKKGKLRATPQAFKGGVLRVLEGSQEHPEDSFLVVWGPRRPFQHGREI